MLPSCPFRLVLVIFIAALSLCEAAQAQSYPPAWNNTSHYVPGDMVTDYGNVYRCLTAVTKPYLDPSKTYADWELSYVRNNTSVLIGMGEPFPNLFTAWNYVRNARVAGAAFLHLNIVTTGGNLNETFSAPLSLDHESGGQISIVGDNVNNIQLSFPNGNALTIDSGHNFRASQTLRLRAR